MNPCADLHLFSKQSGRTKMAKDPPQAHVRHTNLVGPDHLSGRRHPEARSSPSPSTSLTLLKNHHRDHHPRRLIHQPRGPAPQTIPKHHRRYRTACPLRAILSPPPPLRVHFLCLREQSLRGSLLPGRRRCFGPRNAIPASSITVILLPIHLHSNNLQRAPIPRYNHRI